MVLYITNIGFYLAKTDTMPIQIERTYILR
jgi:hypothetical protein